MPRALGNPSGLRRKPGTQKCSNNDESEKMGDAKSEARFHKSLWFIASGSLDRGSGTLPAETNAPHGPNR